MSTNSDELNVDEIPQPFNIHHDHERGDLQPIERRSVALRAAATAVPVTPNWTADNAVQRTLTCARAFDRWLALGDEG